MADVRWIFFDIGSTLVDESACYRARYEEITRNTPVSAAEFEAKAIEFACRGLKGDHAAAEHFGLAMPGWRKELENVYPDAEWTLSTLAARGYRLGVIANQSPGTAQRLEKWGLLPFFDVIAASAEEGVAKPAPEIFLRALSRAGCLPENAVMIGDRLDNDIRPARALGMQTVWVRQGFARYCAPGESAETPDHTVDSLAEITEIFR